MSKRKAKEIPLNGNGAEPEGAAEADSEILAEADPEILAEADPEILEETEDSQETVEELLQRIAALEDKCQRALAEAENVRRRAERQQTEAIAYANTTFARDLLTVADNLDRALKSGAEDSSVEGAVVFVEGIDMTRRELRAVLEKNGVSRIEPDGEKFDHNFHQAMGEVEHPEAAAGTIVEVIQPGYLLRDRLLRPAMVLVAKDAKKSPAGAD